MGQTFWMTHSHKKISIYSDVQSRQNWFSLRETHGQFRHFCISVAVDLDLMTSPGSRNLVITKHRWGRSDMSSHMIQPWYWDGGDQHWPCTPPPHVKYIPHGRSVDIRLISPVGGFDSQMGMGCFSVFSLCMTQLPWAEESCWLGLEPDSHPFRVWFSMTDLTCKVRKVLQWNKAGWKIPANHSRRT